MGRWRHQKEQFTRNEIYEECGDWIGDAINKLEAAKLADAHNADCDAYEARIAELEALVRRVKAESLRVVEIDDDGKLYDWYMTPCGLGYPGKDRKGNNCIESETGYHRLDECKPVRLERWETEE